ncbi:MAG: hypothetical protein ABI254_14505 [Chthoniobacterales bacterium]
MKIIAIVIGATIFCLQLAHAKVDVRIDTCHVSEVSVSESIITFKVEGTGQILLMKSEGGYSYEVELRMIRDGDDITGRLEKIEKSNPEKEK